MEITPIIQQQLRSKYNPEGSVLRKAQLRMLELLIFLDKICTENNLKYWIDSGTLLGAARHGGFIPWDDDTDVCMPREDAMKLKKLMGNKIYEGHIVLQNHETDPNYINSSWMTLRDTKSEYIQDSDLHNSLRYRGLQVDIFIVDKGVSHFLKRATGWYQNHLIYNPWLMKKRSYLRPIVKFTYPLLNKIIIPIIRLVRFNDKYCKDYGCNFGKPFTNDIVYPLKTIKFEGLEFLSPNNVTDYLRIMYGNWKSLPSSDKIHTHNVQFNFYD